MKITIYSTTTCPYCKMLKDYLGEKNVSFTEKLVDQDEQARDEMMKVTKGYLGVPFTLVEKDSGEQKQIFGFDKKLVDQVIF